MAWEAGALTPALLSILTGAFPPKGAKADAGRALRAEAPSACWAGGGCGAREGRGRSVRGGGGSGVGVALLGAGECRLARALGGSARCAGGSTAAADRVRTRGADGAPELTTRSVSARPPAARAEDERAVRLDGMEVLEQPAHGGVGGVALAEVEAFPARVEHPSPCRAVPGGAEVGGPERGGGA